MDEATRNQVGSADPAASTWLTANAGSGKTRVLTDRVARLLLRGTRPERILCLTYTKAAATEMQNRLLRRLGEWAMLPEAELRRALADLGEAGSADLTEARRLFALAIETPGGLKVQTIHSFCAALLRRFPLEAGVPLGFAELDDRSARVLRAEIVEEMAEEMHPAIADLTALHGGHDLDGFIRSLPPGAAEVLPDQAALWLALGLAAGADEESLMAAVFSGDERDLIGALIPLMRGSNKTDAGTAERLAGHDWDQPDMAALATLCDVMLYKSGENAGMAKLGKFPAVGLQRGAAAGLMPDLGELMERVQDARGQMIALASARRSLALHRFAHEFARRYDARKLAHGWLDFEDLISRAAGLLSESSMAQWVLWRLDGGIDHILVDEAQDTSPEQWRVIAQLTDEFTSGAGAVPRERTLFVVGDPKQSIYSFQGADVAVFEDRRDRFADAFAAVEAPMQRRELLHSFRSSPAILRLVDAVFEGEAAQGLGEGARHIAFHEGLPGRVDLWPPVVEPEAEDPPDWWQPGDAPVPPSAETLLAKAIAAQIRAIHGTPFHDIRQRRIRPLDYGDVLILVQGRKGKGLFDEIIRACKAASLPIAGADRLKLAAELAVRDIRAVLSVLDTPEDDLSLAAALRSPLFGLSEDALYRLAAGRKREFLWERLRKSDHAEAHALLTDLMDKVGYLRPYDLISRLLIRHGGRARLLARLGQEAEDGIAELLSQALAYETVETPTLTGFLVWLTGDDVEVRRQAGSGEGGLIRVMTVHGAKGLESPLVILPDTAKRRPPGDRYTIALPDGPTVWRGSKGSRSQPVEDAVAAQTARAEEERRRLLYVGLTRAESWLIVAAAGDTGAGLDSWHAMVSDGAERAGLEQSANEIEGVGTAQRLSFGDWPVEAEADKTTEVTAIALPDWSRTRPPNPTRLPQPVAATALGGAKAIGSGGGAGGSGEEADRDAAMLRGTRLHLLLEHLPGSITEDWPAIARAALAGAEGGLPDADEMAGLLAEAEAVIGAPDLAAVMTPGPGETVLTEVGLTAPLPGIGTLHGSIDRLIVGPDRVLAVDYKSNVEVPADPALTPLGILRQMAAYRAALRLIYPGHRVEAAVLWTATRSLMPLPDAVLDQASTALDPVPPRP
ncbi:double-strand break repair helicase AddA [uncultured Paracoccus sp.]|uniref:double-strand break repair helicase AddA n=1 Tax=uncultured Paracoccus sp. TaxID=189685 RepID=UPI00260F48EA|nr:double-strand break repair helicase AddA [uncultured Paracoccus sp.]